MVEKQDSLTDSASHASRDALLDLIGRLEGAAEGSRELDADVALMNDWSVHAGDNWIGPFAEIAVPNFTTSTEAVLALIGRKFAGAVLDVNLLAEPGLDPPVWPSAAIRWYPPGRSGHEWFAQTSGARTPALALCAVLLKALHAQSMQGDK